MAEFLNPDVKKYPQAEELTSEVSFEESTWDGQSLTTESQDKPRISLLSNENNRIINKIQANQTKNQDNNAFSASTTDSSQGKTINMDEAFIEVEIP